MSASPRVTVVTATFNYGRFVRDAVDSALAQRGTTLEVVVVDDGSTDDTREILRPYFERIRYLHQPNAGCSNARNNGLRSARGEYVLFLDADDYLLPGALAPAVAFLDANPSIGVAAAGWRVVTATGEPVRDVEPWHRHRSLDLRTWLLDNPGLLSATLFRRSWLESIAGPFDESLRRSEDTDLMLRLAHATCPMVWHEAVIVCYRQQPASLTRDASLSEAYAETVLDKFFATPDLPASIRRLERRCRFSRLVWVAWALRRTHDASRVARYLGRSVEISPYDPKTTVLMWANALAAMDRSELTEAEWQVLRTAIGAAAPADVAAWARSAEALEWWIRVWGPYLAGDRNGGDAALAALRGTPADELVALAQTSLTMTAPEDLLGAIASLREGVSKTDLVPRSQWHEFTPLYLTAFGQAMLARRGAVAARALWQALRASRGRGAARAWLRFARNAAMYASGRTPVELASAGGERLPPRPVALGAHTPTASAQGGARTGGGDHATGGSGVDVIIPTHNAARFLAQAIESALAETAAQPAVIVVDDGSTDDTAAVVAPYLDRIRYVRQPRQGQSAARNHGLRLGCSEYVAFMDADDYYVAGGLTQLRETLENRPDLGALQGGVIEVDTYGRELRQRELWHEVPVFSVDTCVRRKPVDLKSMLLRRRWIERVNGFDPDLRFAEDVDLLIRLVAEGCTVEWLRRAIACYRQHDSNITRDAVGEAAALQRVLDKYFQRPDVPQPLRRKERMIRFYSRTFAAWRMYRAGQHDAIVHQLGRALEFTPYDIDTTAREWAKLFEEWCEREQRPPDELAAVQPYLDAALGEVSGRGLYRRWKHFLRRAAPVTRGGAV